MQITFSSCTQFILSLQACNLLLDLKNFYEILKYLLDDVGVQLDGVDSVLAQPEPNPNSSSAPTDLT